VFGIRENCHSSGRSPLLYIFIKRMIKLTVVIQRVIPLLPATYTLLSSIITSKATPYVDEIIGDRQCGFRRNRSATDQIFCICKVLDKEWEYNGTVHKLFIDCEKACDSGRREVLHNNLIEFVATMKLVRLIKCVQRKVIVKSA
jgi:hypothetical protein